MADESKKISNKNTREKHSASEGNSEGNITSAVKDSKPSLPALMRVVTSFKVKKYKIKKNDKSADGATEEGEEKELGNLTDAAVSSYDIYVDSLELKVSFRCNIYP